MKVRALRTFRGTYNMKKGEIENYDNKETVNDLLRMGLIEKSRGRQRR